MKIVVGLVVSVVGWTIIAVATPGFEAFSREYLTVVLGVLMVSVGCGIGASA